MTQLTAEEVEGIATLARLELAEEEKEGMRSKLSSVLAFVDALQNANVEGIEPMAHTVHVRNNFGDDVALPSTKETRDAILAAFPAREGDLLKVKAVFKRRG